MDPHAAQPGPALAGRIKALAREAGYADCGLAATGPFDDYLARLNERIRRFPEAAGLYEPLRPRAAPREGAPWARTIVVCVRRYGKYRITPAIRRLLGHIGRNYLFDRRTAPCPDHAMPRRLTDGLRSLGLRVKRGGVPERAAAVRAGVARIGRNGFAYACDGGSWVNIESWLINAELPPDPPSAGCPCPPDCRACLEDCPTAALAEPFVMRCDRCIAHLTYTAPEPLPDDLESRMGTWVYGCDRCQEVCPLNAGAWREEEDAAWLDAVAAHLTPAALAAMDQAAYERIVHPLFGYIPLDRLDRWQRNARRSLSSASS